MYKVKVISSFSAAHFLKNYKGKCESLHGHNWKVEAVVSAQELNSLGLVLDFKDLKDNLDEVLDGLDHKLLNDLDYFKTHNPTSEEIAYYIFWRLKEKIPFPGRLEEIRVWEKDSSCAIYRE
jgi:6-pyruvoyltetrahydropterin/6-carboxytetrahydropterin synthase